MNDAPEAIIPFLPAATEAANKIATYKVNVQGLTESASAKGTNAATTLLNPSGVLLAFFDDGTEVVVVLLVSSVLVIADWFSS